jgi:hypothetical protein
MVERAMHGAHNLAVVQEKPGRARALMDKSPATTSIGHGGIESLVAPASIRRPRRSVQTPRVAAGHPVNELVSSKRKRAYGYVACCDANLFNLHIGRPPSVRVTLTCRPKLSCVMCIVRAQT